MKQLFKLLLIVFAFSKKIANAHVSLTYPPARNYALDFMDNIRTQKPCGMHPGTKRTVIKNGAGINITWHMGYPHGGGFRLTLVDKNEEILEHLTTEGEFESGNNNETQSFVAYIPNDRTCEECTIRFERQALEKGDTYLFHSCADVKIVEAANFEENCSGHGRYSNGICLCDATYHGDKCQFKNDCKDDVGCNKKGKCVGIGGTTLPHSQCFCEPGYFGFNCEKSSELNEKSFNKTNYRLVSGNRVDFYWRILEKEDQIIEGVIVGQTTSFVAVGWRPKSLNNACYEFPKDAIPYSAPTLHPMDCTDIIIGSVKEGTYSRIADYYTRDRSTPQPDSFYGGEDSLTDALGWEEDGVTTIMFRKPVKANGKSDHDFKNQLHFIWAHGRDDLSFYKEDELKYHSRENRGYSDFSVDVKANLLMKGGQESVSKSQALLIVAIIFILLI